MQEAGDGRFPEDQRAPHFRGVALSQPARSTPQEGGEGWSGCIMVVPVPDAAEIVHVRRLPKSLGRLSLERFNEGLESLEVFTTEVEKEQGQACRLSSPDNSHKRDGRLVARQGKPQLNAGAHRKPCPAGRQVYFYAAVAKVDGFSLPNSAISFDRYVQGHFHSRASSPISRHSDPLSYLGCLHVATDPQGSQVTHEQGECHLDPAAKSLERRNLRSGRQAKSRRQTRVNMSFVRQNAPSAVSPRDNYKGMFLWLLGWATALYLRLTRGGPEDR